MDHVMQGVGVYQAEDTGNVYYQGSVSRVVTSNPQVIEQNHASHPPPPVTQPTQ
ncbi:hypothetical protein LINGRAHAP2_LOCUS14572 [Linum grandiflorum]